MRNFLRHSLSHPKTTPMSFASNTPIHFVPGVGRRTAKILHELGIHTAGQFRLVPEGVLVELFGPSIRSLVSHMQVTKPMYQTTSTVEDPSTQQKQPLFKRVQQAWQFVAML